MKLEPGTTFLLTFQAKATQSGEVLLITLLLAPLAVLHAAESRVFDITTYGAKSDGQTINTSAIQQAIDACHASGGGTVLVPSGVFVTGSLRLKSGVVLRVDKDVNRLESIELDVGGEENSTTAVRYPGEIAESSKSPYPARCKALQGKGIRMSGGGGN